MTKNKSSNPSVKNSFIADIFILAKIMERLKLTCQLLSNEPTDKYIQEKFNQIEDQCLQYPHIEISASYKTSCDYLSYGSVGITVHKNHILVWCSWYHGSEKMIKLSNSTEHNLKIWLENLIPNVEIKTQYESDKS